MMQSRIILFDNGMLDKPSDTNSDIECIHLSKNFRNHINSNSNTMFKKLIWNRKYFEVFNSQYFFKYIQKKVVCHHVFNLSELDSLLSLRIFFQQIVPLQVRY